MTTTTHQVPATTYRLDLDALTVIAIGEDGVETDLNATGEPCRTLEELRQYVIELRAQGLPGWTSDLLDGLEAPTSKREALRLARLAVTMYQQGSGWIVSAWDEEVGCNRTSGEISHPQARQRVTDGRLAVAVRALGGDPSDHDILGGCGALEVRLNCWIECEAEAERELADFEAIDFEAIDKETARSNDLWDAGAEQRYQDELRRLARDDEARAS